MSVPRDGTAADGEVELVEEIPSASAYRALRVAAGLSSKTAEAASRGLPGTLFAVCLKQGGELVGMGRIIGDGGLNYEVVDIAVHPTLQRRGLGSRIMRALVGWLRQNAPASAYVCLIADDGAPALYRKFGFELTAPKSVGMALRL